MTNSPLELDVAFLPVEEPMDVAVIIDVLRMTTTATVLFSRNLDRLKVVSDANAAWRLAQESGALLFGERKGVPLPGFDGGNSPLEHAEVDYRGKTAILCTTNGSKAAGSAAGAQHLLLGAIVNAQAVAQRAAALASEKITLVCAGTDGRVSLDDVLGAACIAIEVMKLVPEIQLSDSARICQQVAGQLNGPDIDLGEARHARILASLGFAADVEFAGRLNSLQIVAEALADDENGFCARTGVIG